MAPFKAWIIPIEGASDAHPEHPIYYPPASPGTPTHPIFLPGMPGWPSVPGAHPEHPIYWPPGTQPHPEHPIVIPPPPSAGSPSHPIEKPPDLEPPDGYDWEQVYVPGSPGYWKWAMVPEAPPPESKK